MSTKNAAKIRLNKILSRYIRGRSTEQEKKFVHLLYNNIPAEKIDDFDSVKIGEDIKRKIDEKLSINAIKPNTVYRKLWQRVAVAATIILVAKFTIDFVNHQSIKDPYVVNKSNSNSEILPGKTSGKLFLEDGSAIELDSIKTNAVIKFDKFTIVKDVDGSISYIPKNLNAKDAVIYNTIVTPIGGEFNLKLADGTKIWINAGSTLKYPIYFGNRTREVELNGEAYFEVAKLTYGNKKLPFLVKTRDQTLKVLGTSFNINSYNKAIKTTLVEGSIQLNFKKNKQYILKPNQQSIYTANDNNVGIIEVDPYYSIAWKSGSFAFQKGSISEVMQTIAQWYNIDVIYQGDLSDVYFTGKISKFENFNKLLQTIELTGSVKFKIEDRRVYVMK